jgi:hypothetical protein
MRIEELFEGTTQFKDLDFVKHVGDKRELDYDLAEDLIHFMHNDDDLYRRHLYPSIMNCADRINLKQTTRPSLFADAIKECYKQYVKKFPIRELPDDIEEKICNDACDKLHEEICKDIKDGKYKD